MLASAKINQVPVRLLAGLGDYGADLVAAPDNTDAVWVGLSRESVLAALNGQATDGVLPARRLAPGEPLPVPGRDETGAVAGLWVVSASGSQWVGVQSW